jgi:hypothetical protein
VIRQRVLEVEDPHRRRRNQRGFAAKLPAKRTLGGGYVVRWPRQRYAPTATALVVPRIAAV